MKSEIVFISIIRYIFKYLISKYVIGYSNPRRLEHNILNNGTKSDKNY